MPMATLAITAIVLSVLMMNLALTGVLRLINELRQAADSIQGERLDVRLPEYGRNEIGDLARSLNGLVGRLQRRSEAQTRFVADASHELATPVAGIRGYIGILRAWGADDPEVRTEAIDAIDKESQRMVRLTGEMLQLIRSDKRSEIVREETDVTALVRDALARTATRYLAKGLEFDGPEGAPIKVLTDPDKLDQLLSILLDNAGKYTDSGRVSAAITRGDGAIYIEVSDSGRGIPADQLDSIFDRFFRADASRSRETEGFGLGLAIAHRLVEALGADISVTSEVDVGTRFTVRLPVDGAKRDSDGATKR
jgi:signal transduction histidine kinase